MEVKLNEYKDRLGILLKVKRQFWVLTWFLLCRYSPVPLYAWRRFICRLFGAKIGRGCHIYPSCIIWAPWNLELGDYSSLAPGVECYSVGRVIIADNVVISQDAFICTAGHDISRMDMPLVVKEIHIAKSSWVCARAMLLPGAKLEEGAVIGLGAVFAGVAAPWGVYIGNPAKRTKERKIA